MAAGAYTLGVAGFLGVGDVFGVDGDIDITTALVRPDGDDSAGLQARTRTVPARWYAAVSKAFELNSWLARSAITGYLGSAVVPGSYDDESARITVEVSVDADAVREVLDRVIDGVYIDVEAIRNLDDLEEDGFDRQPRRAKNAADSVVPAGVACETGTSIATLAPALTDPNTGDRYFATAEHAFRSRPTPTGASVDVDFRTGGRARVGAVANGYPGADVATIEPTGSYSPGRSIDGNRLYNVVGQYTRLGLADLLARGDGLKKVGALTGETSGEIQGIDAVSCLTGDGCRRGQLRWGDETDMTDGDSGSVSFHADPAGDDDAVLVAGFNNARTWWPGQSYVWGIAAHHLTDTYGYHF